MRFPRRKAKPFDLRGIASDTPFKSYEDFEVWRYTLPLPHAELVVSHAQFDHICTLLEEAVHAHPISRDVECLTVLNVRIVPR